MNLYMLERHARADYDEMQSVVACAYSRSRARRMVAEDAEDRDWLRPAITKITTLGTAAPRFTEEAVILRDILNG